MVGPSLIPLLTLSIPGSPTAAVLLGGLLIHGIFPGHDIFTKNPEVIWTFIDSLIIAQILMLIIGLFLSRHSKWIMKVPDNYMAVGILLLAVFGTYSIQNNYSDVLIMFILGTLMYFGSKAGFSPVPVVLGLILGTMTLTLLETGQIVTALSLVPEKSRLTVRRPSLLEALETPMTFMMLRLGEPLDRNRLTL